MTRLVSLKFTVLSGMILVFAGDSYVSAQTVIVRPRGYVYARRHYWRHWGYLSPGDFIAQRIAAQAEVIRASGEFLVNRETAMRLREETVSKAIDNRIKRVQAFYTIREIHESEKLKRMGFFLRKQKRLNELRADLLLNHPELNRLSTVNGSSLNWFLYRLSGSLLAYKFSRPESDRSLDGLSELQLSDELLSKLRLRQKQLGGKRIIFRANSTKPAPANWPFALMTNSYLDVRRKQFVRVRSEILSKDKLSFAEVQRLDQAMMNLRNEFDRVFTKDVRMRNGMRSWQEWRSADLFLKELAGEIGRLKETLDTRLFQGNLKFEGSNLIDLLKFMARHGLEFHAAETRDEWAYHAVHKMLRDIYAVVHAKDAGAHLKDGK